MATENTKMTFTELMTAIHDHFPGSTVKTTKDGRIVITTDLMQTIDREVDPHKIEVVKYKPKWDRPAGQQVLVMGHKGES